MRVGKICIREKRGQLPGVSDFMRFQPGLDRFFAFDAGKFVFVFRGF